MEEDVDAVVESIYTALGGKVDKEKIKEEVLNAVKHYRIDMREIKRFVIQKLGGDVSSAELRRLGDLLPGEGRITLRVKILSINSKEYEIDGTKRIMHYGLMGDESGVLPFTAWTLDTELKKGDCVEIKNAYTKEWQDRVKVVIGQNTRVSLLPPNSVKVKSSSKKAKIVELYPRMGLVEVVGKVISVDKRNITVEGVPREVYSGVLADETGEILFTSWDGEVKEGEVIRVSGAYVSTYRGMPQLVFDSRSQIKREDMDIEIKTTPVDIESLEGKGGLNVLIEGVIIDIRDGSGLIYRCPECGRVLNGTTCSVHGRVNPKPDLRIKAIVDDGTGAVLCLFNRELTEKIMGFSLSEAVEKVKANMGNTSVIMDEIEEKLIASPIILRGNVVNDDKYGLKMFVNSFEKPKLDDISAKAEKLLEEMGW